MNPFAILYLIMFAYAGFFIVWHKRKSWAPKEQLIANLAGWSLLIGAFLRLFIETIGKFNYEDKILRSISGAMLPFSFGAFICLVILTSKNKP